MIKKILGTAFLVAILIAAYYGFNLYNTIYGSAVKQDTYLYIPTGSSYQEVLQLIDSTKCIESISGFDQVAELKSYPDLVKPGRYLLKKGMSNEEAINKLRIGTQDPVNFTFNNLRTIQQLAGVASRYFEPDSLSFLDQLTDPKVIKKYGFNQNQFPSLFIPNTYEMNWNTTAEEFIARMAREYKTFWTPNRQQKARQLNLSQSDVSTLASIVESETVKSDEKARVAGVYINRLQKGMPLQADPTLIFALGDFSIKRVTNDDKKIESPYNTYKYKGLPPGPIRLSEISSLESVLNYERHNFIYFCAKEDFSGYHNFTSSYRKHRQNARKYQNALNKRKIYR
ncbi:MAG: aminodeoxychorismate lyase [Crocinitomicaceae bacterium]|nr:aminodeoxychorismate lyase [Crocinitomicaceae bacterium]|tara:strand:- start:266 stop:1288 length:1023 start_codon:yes stop_codon:yes gene_type:complete